MKLPRKLECSYEDYLADNICASVPTLNASTAKVLIQKSPAHAFLEHPKLGKTESDDCSKSMDKGSVIHSLLLGTGKGIAIVNADNWRKKEHQEERDAKRMEGFIPLLMKEADEIQLAAMEIHRQMKSLGFDLDQGISEFGIHWKSEEGVECRRSLDNWTESKLLIIELKSIFCAHPDICTNQAMRLGYDIEYAVSLEAIYTLYPDLAGRVEFLFIFFELEPPYAVTPLRPDGSFLTIGLNKWQRAKEIWKQCLASNHWPTYLDSVGILSAPQWSIRAELEKEFL